MRSVLSMAGALHLGAARGGPHSGSAAGDGVFRVVRFKSSDERPLFPLLTTSSKQQTMVRCLSAPRLPTSFSLSTSSRSTRTRCTGKGDVGDGSLKDKDRDKDYTKIVCALALAIVTLSKLTNPKVIVRIFAQKLCLSEEVLAMAALLSVFSQKIYEVAKEAKGISEVVDYFVKILLVQVRRSQTSRRFGLTTS